MLVQRRLLTRVARDFSYFLIVLLRNYGLFV